jgi:3-oxoacid CoA-transferase subunit A
MHIMELAYKADFAIVKHGKDEAELIFKGTARNFNACMAGAGKTRSQRWKNFTRRFVRT